ncbi:MAG: hypothetical protein PVI81_02110 [Anaerolineales bacterium]|jgi:hypothetical protein
MPHIEVVIKGRIDAEWTDWFEGLNVDHRDNDTTRLHGEVADQSALYGILARLRDLGLELISVDSVGMNDIGI